MRTARIAGALFLIAMVTSLGGGLWLDSILAAPDYLGSVSANETQVLLGALLELINCAAVVGIAVVLYPLLKRVHEATALGYVGFRVVEAVVLAVAAVAPLSLVALSEDYVQAGPSAGAALQSLGTVILDGRGHLTGLLTPVFFGVAALLLYCLLFRSKLVPAFISVWGILSVVLMLGWNLLEAFGISLGDAGLVFALPMILNEIFLGFWLIVKGFNASAVLPGSAE